MEDHKLDDRIKAVERLTELFKIERIVHLVVTSVSLVMLLFSAGITIFKKGNPDPAFLALMFGSSGLIAYSANRLLHMWDQALRILAAAKDEEAK